MRWFIIFLLWVSIFACTSRHPEHRSSNVTTVDTARQPTDMEPFDLRVRKYEDPVRESWQNPNFILYLLGPLKNKTVADIGAGTGYFSFRMAPIAKKVIAIDVEKRFLDYIEDRKQELANGAIAKKIETKLASSDDPGLTPGQVDVVLMVNTLSFIKNHLNYLQTLHGELKPNTKIVIVDYKQGVMPIGQVNKTKINANELIDELGKARFVITKTDTVSLQYQYVIVAKS